MLLRNEYEVGAEPLGLSRGKGGFRWSYGLDLLREN